RVGRAHHGGEIRVIFQQFAGRILGGFGVVDVALHEGHAGGVDARLGEDLQRTGHAITLHVHARPGEPLLADGPVVGLPIEPDAQNADLAVTCVDETADDRFDGLAV